MIPEIENKLSGIIEICRRYQVRYLALVGSATRSTFDARKSDLDFLVEFDEIPPSEYVEAYFNLQEGLEQLLNRPVDLITHSAVINPYLRQEFDNTREELYAA